MLTSNTFWKVKYNSGTSITPITKGSVIVSNLTSIVNTYIVLL
jgi:hypothetical protein